MQGGRLMAAASFAPSRLFGRSSESLERRVLFNAFVVDTLDDTSLPDDGVVSLREAVQLANTSPGDDRILFAGDVRGTITLTGGQLDVTDASGSLTIEGPGAAALSVSGNGATRVIQIGAAASADISGLTITAGRADTGGGISTADGTFTVTRCTFDGNQATGPIGKGGAIYTKNGSVIVIGCTFSGNSADQSGGGIHSEAINSPRPTILSVADSSFLSNLAVGGGGISTVYPSTFSTCTVTNTTFDANRASSFGGAIN